MFTERIDLYEYYKIPRPQDSKGGYINSYIHHFSYDHSSRRTRPAILVVAGGCYHNVAEREKEPIALAYLYKGFNAFTLEYSVVNYAYPTQLIEGCMAIRYIREHSEQYHIDKDHICAIGSSAGGHLVGTLANHYLRSEVQQVLGDTTGCKLNAVLFNYPVILSQGPTHQVSIDTVTGGNKDLLELLSIDKQITKNSPPAFIWTLYNDAVVPCENSLELAKAYKRAGVPFEFHLFFDGAHGCSLGTQEVVNKRFAINKPIQTWFEMSITWLENRGFLIQENYIEQE